MALAQTSGVRIFPPLIHLAAIATGFLIQWAVPVRIGGSSLGIGRITVVVTNGPFRFTRNPMYLAWELICIGVGLAANALWPIAMAVPAAIVTRRLVIDKEGRCLEQKFGIEYLDYRSRVRRRV